MRWLLKYWSSHPWGDIQLNVHRGKLTHSFRCNKAMREFLVKGDYSGKVANALGVCSGVFGIEASMDKLLTAVVENATDACFAILKSADSEVAVASASAKQVIYSEMLFPSDTVEKLYTAIGRPWACMEVLWPMHIGNGLPSKVAFNPAFLERISMFGIDITPGLERDAVFEFFTLIKDTVDKNKMAEEFMGEIMDEGV